MSLRHVLFLVLTGICYLCAGQAHAHEVRPGFLEIVETSSNTFDVTWKQPVKDGRRLKIDPVFPEICGAENESVRRAPGAIVLTWTTRCDLDDAVISVGGLDRTLTDVMVRIELLDEGVSTHVLRPGQPEMVVGNGETGAPLGAYLRIGVEHIVFGYDHLLFVIAIVLLVQARQLLGTITAFTLAHSITLGLAMTTDLSVPSRMVEITIALSIALLAVEIVQKQKGRPALTAQRPWLIAFAFGLVHGLGFAGALSEIGLPDQDRLIALLLFNLGVELGQLAVVVLALGTGWLFKRALSGMRSQAVYTSSYAIGIIGMFWAIERALMVSGA